LKTFIRDMWTMALGIAMVMQAEPAHAGEQEGDRSAVHVECPSDPGEDCTADEDAVTEAPAAASAAPAAAMSAGPTNTAFATVSFRNDVGKALRLVEAQFTLDGEKVPVVLTSAEPGKSYVIVSRAVKPGPHVVSARLTYRGDNGVFSYMKGYKLNVRSDQLLTATADRSVSVTVVGREKKGLTVPLEKRVMVTVEDGRVSR
jgi:hypothetical protein